jgi:hypothetical protein
MRKTLGERELAVVKMAEMVGTSHMSMAMGPQGPCAGLSAKKVDFLRRREDEAFRLRVALHTGLILDIRAFFIGHGSYRVIWANVGHEHRAQDGFGFELKSALDPRSTRPGGYSAVQTYRFLLRSDGFIHHIE